MRPASLRRVAPADFPIVACPNGLNRRYARRQITLPVRLIGYGDAAMASGIDEVAAVCSRTLDTGSMLLRGAPAFAAWYLGWLSKEFAPHVLTGHALSAIPSPLVPMASKMAAQRADSVLDAAMTETFGEAYHDLVRHPLEPYTARRPHVSGVVSAMLRRRETATTNISYGPGGRNQRCSCCSRRSVAR